jgi:hypothetical protein
MGFFDSANTGGSQSAFEVHLRALANQCGLRVAEVDDDVAKLIFTFERQSPATEQVVWVTPYGETWEFSCLSVVRERDPLEIPQSVLVYALLENSKSRRGYWTLNKYETSGNVVLECMDNIPSLLITADEFNDICWAVARRVDSFERLLSTL